MRPQALFVIALLLLAAAAPAAADHRAAKEYKEGQVYCTASALVMGPTVIEAGRCYLLALYRDARGSFLAFINAAVLISPGQVIRLDTPSGRRLRDQIAFLVPLQAAGLTPAAATAGDTLQLVAVREEHRHEAGEADTPRARTVLVLAGLPAPELSATFVVRF